MPGIGIKNRGRADQPLWRSRNAVGAADEIKQRGARPLLYPLSALRVKLYDPDKLFPFLDEMELRALKSRVEKRLALKPTSEAERPSEPVIPKIPPFTAERTYEVVDAVEVLEHWIESVEQAGWWLIWPAPSTVAGTRPEWRGLAMAVPPGRAAYVPLGHCAPAEHGVLRDASPVSGGLTREEAVARLKPLFENPAVLKIGHDIKGMVHLLRRYGIALQPY